MAMRRFRFRLERVLRLRSGQERQARRALAGAARRLAGLEAKIADLAQSMLACEPDQLAPGGIAGLARALRAGFAASMNAARVEREQAVLEVEHMRAAYLARRKEH